MKIAALRTSLRRPFRNAFIDVMSIASLIGLRVPPRADIAGCKLSLPEHERRIDRCRNFYLLFAEVEREGQVAAPANAQPVG